jgi:hypothetical protein
MLNDVSKNEALIDDCWVNMPATATEAIPLINVVYEPTSTAVLATESMYRVY